MREQTPWGTLLALRHRGSRVTGQVCFGADLRCFEGHFPGSPIFPAAAQLQMVQEIVGRALGRTVRLRRLGRVKFNGRLEPGTVVDFRIDLGEAGDVRYTFAAGRRDISGGALQLES